MSYNTELQSNNAELEGILQAVNELPESVTDAVLYTEQTLTEEQKAQARQNIGAISEVDAPQKGVDYWTSEDQESIVQQVITALGTPVFGRVDADNNIILTGELADGTYVLKYEDAEGNLTEIGTLEHSQTPSDPDDPDISDGYTNLADTTSADWLNGHRLNGSGGLTKESVSYTTNYIPVKEGDVVRVRGLNIWFYGSGTGYATTNFYDEGKTRIGKITPWEQKSYFGATKQEPETDFVYTVANGATMVSGDTSQIRYIRFSGRLVNGYTADDVIITVNQEITDESVEPDVPVEPDEPAYVNLADPTSSDWLTGQRLNSSGEVKTEAVAYTTNYIPLKVGDVVRIRGLNIYFYNSTNGYSTVHFYNESKARVGKITPYNNKEHFGHTASQTANPPTDVVYTVGNGSVEMSSGDTSGIRYARFSGRLIDGYTVDDIIITVNQEITD